MTVPRDPNGHFLPPQFRLESVPVGTLREGDWISWNVHGKAERCQVVHVVPWDGQLYLLLRHPSGVEEVRPLEPTTTVNRVEVLR